MAVDYRFEGGFPTAATVQAAYDAADHARAVVCYKHFFPAVSGMAIWAGTQAAGVVPNRVFGTMDTRPGQVGFTLNSDTPYGPVLLDLAVGPLVVTVPAGPIIGAALNTDQSWISDIGIPGPDHGHGGRHIFLPPGWTGDDPADGFVHRPVGNRVVVGLRAIPQHRDVDAAITLLRSVQVAPLDEGAEWAEPSWTDLTGVPQDTTPLAVQGTMGYWELLQQYIDTEPAHPGDVAYLGELAAIGIRAGEPFAPDDRMRGILAQAAADADAQLRVQSLADRRPDRVVWPDRHWEWVTLRPENPNFEIDKRTDVDARETWFYQAIATSPVMFRRQAGSGSLYWFISRDGDGAYLEGGTSYRLRVPLPVPAGLFWSLTVYDAETRSQIDTPQGNAALRSLFELDGQLAGDHIDLHFGPNAPADEAPWVQTLPGRGWFAYFRIYGPSEAAFDGTWKPGDPTAEPAR
ncbi:DUF1214 domain-containing protein [Microbacterium aoyamense]|uniref:DUF1214 domain-containing protein n=1 Tax=Microbacterium aoyamense TaxID=344166 RepID=UPI002005E7B8|nr:DUF1214 domain-containing protein [Microbacterium aoyamense]